MSSTKFKHSSKLVLSDGKTSYPNTSPLSSASCSCYADESSADDSSSLGYGSGHSSTYSDVVEAQIDDFYRNSNSAAPTTPRRPGVFDEAEFYDLDSVDNFSLGSYDYDDCVETDLAANFNLFRLTALSSAAGGSLPDFDLVEPSDLFRRSFSAKVAVSETRPVKPGENSSSTKPCAALRSIPEEEHIYEEVHYDTPDLNLEGVRPPPLPRRTYCYHPPPPTRRRAVTVSGMPNRKVSNQGIRKVHS